MKRIGVIIVVLIAITFKLEGQNFESYSILDSNYLHRDIVEMITSRDIYGSKVEIVESLLSKEKRVAFREREEKEELIGYRVRIFFSNDQRARARSQEIVERFEEEYPEITTYRTYDNPYFKVTVGDLRTKSEAMVLLKRLEKEYNSAFIVKEKINFPPL